MFNRRTNVALAGNDLQISEGTNSVGFSEGFGLLLMCCYARCGLLTTKLN